MRIMVLVRTEGLKGYYRHFVGEDVEIRSVVPEGSEIPASVSPADELYFVEGMKLAEKDGFDAIVSACHLSPGVEAGRVLVKIPVLSVGCVGMHFSAMLGHKFSIIGITPGDRRAWLHRAVQYGCETRLASVRYVDLSEYVGKLQRYGEVAEMAKEISPEMERVLGECITAIEEDDATVIMLGCGALTWMGDRLAELLKSRGYDATLVNPLPLTIEVAKALVSLKISHSRLAYLPVD